jgi:uncharacterized secreted protein with C-terminal beta-propeller domain
VPVPGASGASTQANAAAVTGDSVSRIAYSQTNNQVSGVDELDTVKTDGQYIFTVTNNTVAVVLANPTEAKPVAFLSLNGSIQGMFVHGNRLVIVTQEPYYKYPAPLGLGISVRPEIYPPIMWPIRSPTTSLWSFDVSDHSKPVLTTSLIVNGTLAGARLVGDYVYLISTASVYCNGPIILPSTVVNKKPIGSSISQVYHSDLADLYHTFTSIVSVNISQENPDPTLKILLLGTSNMIYVSQHDIFLTQPVWNMTESTVVHRVHIDLGGISYEATGSVSGHVLNQFSMDQYNGYFRIVTTDYPMVQLRGITSSPAPTTNVISGQETNLYVMDSSLHIYGKIEGLSPGERFHSARFMESRAYLVTFKNTDPLFVIDLQNPAKPAVIGELNVNGYSDYLQPYDQTHLIGIGKDALDTGVNFAFYQGVKVSLFDVSDTTHPREIGKYVIGARGTDSLALREHKSVLFDRSLNLLVIPVEVALAQNSTTPGLAPSPTGTIGTILPWQYNQPVWQGVYVFRITTDGIVFRGGITHLKPNELPTWTNQESFVTRSLYIGNVLYTISNNLVRMNSLTDLSAIGLVQLSA